MADPRGDSKGKGKVEDKGKGKIIDQISDDWFRYDALDETNIMQILDRLEEPMHPAGECSMSRAETRSEAEAQTCGGSCSSAAGFRYTDLCDLSPEDERLPHMTGAPTIDDEMIFSSTTTKSTGTMTAWRTVVTRSSEGLHGAHEKVQLPMPVWRTVLTGSIEGPNAPKARLQTVVLLDGQVEFPNMFLPIEDLHRRRQTRVPTRVPTVEEAASIEVVMPPQKEKLPAAEENVPRQPAYTYRRQTRSSDFPVEREMANMSEDGSEAAGLGIKKMMGLPEEDLYRVELMPTVEELASKVLTPRQKGTVPAAKENVPRRSAYIYGSQKRSLDTSEEEFKRFPEREMAKIMKTAIIDSTRAREEATLAGQQPRPARFSSAGKEVLQERVNEIEKSLGFIAPYTDDQANEIRTPKRLKSFDVLAPARVLGTAANAPTSLDSNVKTDPSQSTPGDGSIRQMEPHKRVETGEPPSKSKESDDVNTSSPGGLASATHLELARNVAQGLGSVQMAADARSAPLTGDGLQREAANATTNTPSALNARDGVQQRPAYEQSIESGHRSRSEARSDSRSRTQRHGTLDSPD